jgi:hypothetical protein
VALIGASKLDLDLKSARGFRVLQEKVQSPGSGLRALPVFQNQVPKAEDGRVFGDAVLDPAFVQLWVAAYGNDLELSKLHVRSPSLNRPFGRGLAEFCHQSNATKVGWDVKEVGRSSEPSPGYRAAVGVIGVMAKRLHDGLRQFELDHTVVFREVV